MGATPTPAQAWELLCDRLHADAVGLHRRAREITDALHAGASARSYRDLPPAFAIAAQAWTRELPPAAAGRVADLLLLESSMSFAGRIDPSTLPAAVLPEFHKSIDRIVRRCLAEPARPLDLLDDVFLKDLAILRGVMVPCVSHLIFRHSGVPRRLLAQQPPSSWPRLLRHFGLATRGLAPFMENHVHPDMLQEFDAEGRERCYRLIAALLAHWPDSKGLIGSSWYYDARAGEISPHLRYLREVPARHGALFLRAGRDADVLRDATATSATRRRLFEQGAYRPERHFMTWARRDLLAAYGP